jgi:hypothetical protein
VVQHLLARRGAARIALIPPEVLEALNEGLVPTVNLNEFLALDLARLARNVARGIGLDPGAERLEDTLAMLAAFKPIKRHHHIARALYDLTAVRADRDAIAHRLALHPSDIARNWAAQSALIPRIMITPPSMAVSDLMRLARPSALVPADCQPCWNSLERTSGVRAMSAISCDSLATIGLGMDCGAAAAVQISSWKPRMPCSFRLGYSGTSGLRLVEVTPMAFSLPALICAAASAGGSSASWIWPPIMALITCGLPGYGTCTGSMLVLVFSSSMPMWPTVPTPGEP